jgi:hypothetical protein
MSRSFLTFRTSRRFLIITSLFVIIIIIGFAALFAFQDVAVQQYFKARTAKAVVSDYVDNAVLKTLELLVVDVDKLHIAAKELQADQSTGNLDAAVIAWYSAHGTWNMAAAYLYGPAAQYDYHKQLATWPCDKVLVENALSMMETGELEVDARYLREERVAALRGFYTIQYLLFRNGQPRKATNISSTELSYLTAATQALLEESIDFEASWRGTKNLSLEKLAILNKAGIKNRPGFAEEFKNPGYLGSRYASLSTPLQEVFQEISGVLEDMVPVIDELHETTDSGEAAYWDSLDPYADLLNRLQSVENAYLGGVEGSRGRSVSELLASHDRALDRLIKISLAHTTYRIAAIRDFRGKSPEDRELALRIAEAELEKLMARFSVGIPQVILDPAVEPYAAYVK